MLIVCILVVEQFLYLLLGNLQDTATVQNSVSFQIKYPTLIKA